MRPRDGDAAFSYLLGQGKVAQEQGRPADAVRVFGEAARLRPASPEAAFALCLAQLHTADPRAGMSLQDLLARFPAHAAGWEDLGFWFLKASQAEAALVCLTRAAAVAPSATRSLGRGSALKNLGRSAEARTAFAEACQQAPRSARAAFLLGLCAQDARDYPAARAAYDRAIALDPDLPEAWVNLGIVRQALGDVAGAKQAYGAALRRRADTFGRVSQALTGAPRGELWLDLGRLRRSLAG